MNQKLQDDRVPLVIVAYLAKAKYGGWPTFTHHLCASLRAAGVAPMLRVVGARPSSDSIDFGFGLRARRVSITELCNSKEPVLIAAADKQHAREAKLLLDRGAHIVVHDPAEKHLSGVPETRTVVIRRSMKRRLPGSNLILHPYLRAKPARKEELGVISHSRVDFDKYTHIICEANDINAGIRVFGAANNMYVHFKIHPTWPNFKPEAFPRTAHAGAHLCARASAIVDMSAIKHDGGGSQYSFLEAWDAGTPLIINRRWIEEFPDDEMQHGHNCLAAKDAEELKRCVDAVLNDAEVRTTLVNNGYKSLEQHDPERIGTEYRTLLRV
jgi:hypothetical protein